MRLIDADKLPRQYEFSKIKKQAECIGFAGSKFSAGVMAVWDALNNAPTVAPVKHGHWITLYDNGRPYTICSCCNQYTQRGLDDEEEDNRLYITSDFCPNCGARLKEVESE